MPYRRSRCLYSRPALYRHRRLYQYLRSFQGVTMNFDTKIAVVIREDLLVWQKLNVTAFTISGIASLPDVMGENYVDGSGNVYLPMIKQPITIFRASSEQIRAVYQQALGSEAQLSIYTEELFSTPHDDANRA